MFKRSCSLPLCCLIFGIMVPAHAMQLEPKVSEQKLLTVFTQRSAPDASITGRFLPDGSIQGTRTKHFLHGKTSTEHFILKIGTPIIHTDHPAIEEIRWHAIKTSPSKSFEAHIKENGTLELSDFYPCEDGAELVDNAHSLQWAPISTNDRLAIMTNEGECKVMIFDQGPRARFFSMFSLPIKTDKQMSWDHTGTILAVKGRETGILYFYDVLKKTIVTKLLLSQATTVAFHPDEHKILVGEKVNKRTDGRDYAALKLIDISRQLSRKSSGSKKELYSLHVPAKF